jgi:hypothetical protein
MYLGYKEKENLGMGDCWIYSLGLVRSETSAELEQVKATLKSNLFDAWRDTSSIVGQEIRKLISEVAPKVDAGDPLDDPMLEYFDAYLKTFSIKHKAGTSTHMGLICALKQWDLVVINGGNTASCVTGPLIDACGRSCMFQVRHGTNRVPKGY